MSSWIPSLLNPFTDDDDDGDHDTSSSNEITPYSGAKEDLSAVFRGVAAFLAPPPQTTETISGIKNDLAEIQGSFRSGLSLISSKLTSNFLHFQTSQPLNDDDDDDDDDEDEDAVVGITDQVVDFVSKISERPELWIDFPLPLSDDFDLSDYQRDHAANMDDLVPEFVTLRQKLSSQISDGKFWLIYFILLLPRLNEEDSKLLSTPQVNEARATLLNKLQNKNDGANETSENPESSERESQDDKVVSVDETKQRDIVNEEDVSFSDLEDEDEDEDESDLSDKDKAHQSSVLKDKGSESEEWLTVDDTDFDNLAPI